MGEMGTSRLIVDSSTRSLVTVNYEDNKIHEGDDFFLTYSVASLGAMTLPDDMITLTFTTPDTTKWGHFKFKIVGTAGWRIRLIEAPTGGGATPTGSLSILNSNRNSSVTSGFLDVAGTPVVNKISYDATLATGGITLLDEYLI